MKSFTYQLSTSDVKTLLVTLTVMSECLPDLNLEGVSPTRKSQVLLYCDSAIEKLSNEDDIASYGELDSIYLSLRLANMINYGYLFVDDDTSRLCRQYIFGIQKLLPIFEAYSGN